jgi:miniconductance mechanosensitive channel
MLDGLERWLIDLGFTVDSAPWLAQATLLIGILLVGYLLRVLILLFIRRGLSKWIEKTETYWDDVFYRSNFFLRLSNLLPLLLIYFTAVWMPDLSDWIRRITLALIAFTTARALEAALTAINDIYDDYEVAKSKPIKGYTQVGKIILWLFALILIVSALMKSSPLLLLGGLGAFSAVLLLVFRDTLLGLFASVQFVTNDMVRIGDWIEMPEYNADGEVIDISVNTVKVSNWDKTISTIPTYALMSNSFKNWRGMEMSGGRRMKRALYIDLNSIRFLDKDLLAHLSGIRFIRDYLEEKKKEAVKDDRSHHINLSNSFAGHDITNLGAFRAYVIGYLRYHPKVNQEMDVLVRYLAPSESGLPLELYAFLTEKTWERFEDIQAEIFDHLLAILPEFQLSAYQNPSGQDIRAITVP